MKKHDDEQRLNGVLANTTITRRRLLAAGAMSLALPAIARPALAQAAAAPSIDAARNEGALVLWHGDQESDTVELLKAYTEKTGLEVVQQRLLPGAAVPKLEAEYRAGQSSVDVYLTSDAGIMEQLRQQQRLLRFVPRDIDAYAANYRSGEPGHWTAYSINVGPMMYNPQQVPEATAPKDWMGLLDPRWKGGIGFQNSSAGTSYAFWFVLKDRLPKDYWEKLAAQKPRAYASSTQIVQDIERGNLKIGGRVSILQYVQAIRKKQPLNMVLPAMGVPSNLQVAGIIGTTKRPNAAKVFVDYLLSKEGQHVWGKIQGLYSPRPDVDVEHLPPITSLKLLVPEDFKEYMSAARRKEFVTTWNKMTGL